MLKLKKMLGSQISAKMKEFGEDNEEDFKIDEDDEEAMNGTDKVDLLQLLKGDTLEEDDDDEEAEPEFVPLPVPSAAESTLSDKSKKKKRKSKDKANKSI